MVAPQIDREVSIMKVIEHPNVIRLLDVLESEKRMCVWLLLARAAVPCAVCASMLRFLVVEHAERGELFDYLVSVGRLKTKVRLIQWKILRVFTPCGCLGVSRRPPDCFFSCA